MWHSCFSTRKRRFLVWPTILKLTNGLTVQNRFLFSYRMDWLKRWTHKMTNCSAAHLEEKPLDCRGWKAPPQLQEEQILRWIHRPACRFWCPRLEFCQMWNDTLVDFWKSFEISYSCWKGCGTHSDTFRPCRIQESACRIWQLPSFFRTRKFSRPNTWDWGKRSSQVTFPDGCYSQQFSAWLAGTSGPPKFCSWNSSFLSLLVHERVGSVYTWRVRKDVWVSNTGIDQWSIVASWRT